MARSVWKGPFVRAEPAEEGRGSAGGEQHQADQDLVAAFDDSAAVRRTDASTSITGTNLFPFRFRKKWSATSSANLRPRAHSRVTLRQEGQALMGKAKSTPPRGR